MSSQSHAYQLVKDINLDIFRAYDIRGIVAETLTPNVVYSIARAVAAMALDNEQDTLILARDGRLSGSELAQAVTAGLKDGGCDVLDIGQVPTPMMYYATHCTNTQSGIMLTGSHNPSHYNGLKIVINGVSLYEDQILSLYQRIQTENLTAGSGIVLTESLNQQYLEQITDDVHLDNPLKVVIDCGNGVAGVIAGALFRKLGCEVTELYCDVDGTFPNHHPDPSEEANLKDLIAEVQLQQAHVGLAFDGDGDRLGVVTADGKIIAADRLMMLFAKDVLEHEPNAPVIFDVKCSRHLADVIQQNGGRPVMSRTGHSLIKAAILEHDAVLAGEMSGHLFFHDRYFGYDDALYAGARLLEILAHDPDSASALFQALPDSYATPEIKIAIDEARKFEFLENFKRHAQFGNAKLNTIDGVRVEYPDGWGLLRCSNTTPYLVLRFEADTQAALERIQQTFREQLSATDNTLAIGF